VRLLFVSGTTLGGSGRSQRELAAQLVRLGHDVLFLVDDRRPATSTRWLYEHLADLSVRLDGRPGRRAATWLASRQGRRTTPLTIGGLSHLAAALPQNALSPVVGLFQPDILVVSSVERWAWRNIHRQCREWGVPMVLYIRETDSLAHLAGGSVPDAVVANAESLAASVRSQGLPCAFVPSVIDVDVTRTGTTRRVALAINPIESRGGDIVWQVAHRLPAIPFVVQESWPLKGAQLASVEERVRALPNVEFRRTRPAGPDLYADCRVLLVPYRVDNRPRVIAEAQANGIPAIVADVPALVEAVGPGGLSVPLNSIDAWVDSLARLWDDEQLYLSLADAAAAHSTRPDIDPRQVVQRFIDVVAPLVAPGSARGAGAAHG
jgi:glycosyltransferase involved in cell wall biosynthesis